MTKKPQPSSASYQQLNKFVAELYNKDIALHTRVRNFFHVFSDVVYYDKCSIIFYHKTSGGKYKKHSSISVNWEQSQDLIQKYNTYYCYMDDCLSALDRPDPLVFNSTVFFDMKKRTQTEYWKDYLIPTNTYYSVDGNLQIKSSRGLLGYYGFFRNEDRNDFNDEELEIIKMLQPHLSNLFKHYMEYDDSDDLPFMLENYNCVGVCILDENLQLFKSNSKFKSINDDHAETLMNKIITLCYDLNKRSDDKGRLCNEYKFDDTPLFLEISKTSSGKDDLTEQSKFQYCCLVYDLSYFFAQTLHKAKEKYYLSPREFDVITSVLKGKRNEDIAKDLYVSVPSVKKDLASIYSKMEITTQKQIFDKLKLI